ncbi:MAG TPA: RNA polymerase sigma factor [Candidatus Binataceae bacterium]|nr:RNA polymerase sigma factor [Candidatus Binataceae bacterium]
MEFSDEELCRRVAQREADAFELLLKRYQARAFRLAYSMLGNEADARDLSQDAFIRVYETAHQFDGRSRFATWFHRVLVNLCIDHQRRGKWWQKVTTLWQSDDESEARQPPEPESPDPGPEAEAIRTQDVSRLETALARLSPKQRAAVLLQAHEGLSSREIADVLKCSDNTARVHLHRGLAELRKLMKEN